MNDWLQHAHWLGTPIFAWMLAGLAALCAYAIAHLVAKLLVARLRGLEARTRRSGFGIAAHVAEATRSWLLLLIAVAVTLDIVFAGTAASGHVERTAKAELHLATYCLIGIQVAFWINALLVAWLRRSAAGDDARKVNPVMLGVLTWLVQCVVWVTLLLALLAEGGINISAFVASLGIGGVAVALGLQTVLTDLFASISIGLDKPFEVGESIAFDPGQGVEQGTVTRVGIKSTRIRAVTGEELSVSNSVLLKCLIHNQSRRRERRITLALRLPFDTPRERIPEVIARVRACIEREPLARFERGWLAGFGEHGLNLEFVYDVLNPDFNTGVELQQRINLALLQARDELGLAFAVPALALQAATPGAGPATPQPPG